MQSLFDKVITHIQSQNGFRSYGPDEWKNLPEEKGALRHPKFEGDFATTTDVSLLLHQGIDVPQEAINLSRISSTRALEKTMPDWAVREWLGAFLQRSDLPRMAGKIFELHKESLRFMPTGKRRRFFDFRIARHAPDIRQGGIFTADDAAEARHLLAESQPHIVAGVLLWQFALQNYAEALSDHLKSRKDLSESFKTRAVSYCLFLGQSAFRLASFSALLPMAIVTYAGRYGDGPVMPECVSPAIADFSSRGGFVRHGGANPLRYFFRRFRPLPKESRVIVCSAKEALVRWAALPNSLGEYISKAQSLMAEHAEWRALGKNIGAILRTGRPLAPAPQKNSGDGKALAGCPFHSSLEKSRNTV
jgi:hypothetical protein